MAIEGVVANPGVGGAEFATDQVSGGSGTVDVPYAKLMDGTDGSAAVIPGDATLGLFVQVKASTLPSGAATSAKQDTGNTSLASIDGKITACNTGAVVISSGSITANAGTNLNTSALALESGGNLAGAATSLALMDDAIVADDAAFTPGTTKVMMSGFQADETATDSVNEGDGGAARMTLDRKVITTPQPHSAGGLLIARDIDLDNSTLTVVKNGPGQLYGWDITNRGTAPVYVKFYNATSGTLGTGTPVMTIAIPANASDYTMSSKALAYGILFDTGICVGAGTGVADNDNTDPGANIVVANIYYF